MNSWAKLLIASIGLLFLGLFSAMSMPRFARAAGTLYVMTTGDDALYDCLTPSTPCASINAALNKPGFVDGDVIKVAIGTYYGTGNEVVLLNRSATLSGGWDATFSTQSGISTIDGQGARRGVTADNGAVDIIDRFTIQNGSGSFGGGGIYNHLNVVTIRNSTIYNNYGIYGGGVRTMGGALTLTNSKIISNSAAVGGGIENFSPLTITNSTIEKNVSGNAEGGGIYHNCFQNLTIQSSAIISNTGTGIYNGCYADIYLNNSTVSGNTGDYGGGINNIGGVYVRSSTIAGNSAIRGGGIWGSATLENSIVASNTASVSAPDCGFAYTNGYNLVGNTADCNFTPGNGDKIDQDPKLGPLQDNGGSTLTHAIKLFSPAVNGGKPSGCTDNLGNLLVTDQRGIPRVGGCDMGAYEFQTPMYDAFVPLVENICNTTSGIYGTVRLNNVPIADVALQLQFSNGTSWSTISTAYTASDGSYAFVGMPKLGVGQAYYVRYTNGIFNNRLSYWGTRVLRNYNGCGVHIGDFDIANIYLVSPDPGDSIHLPLDFTWRRRQFTPSDTYEWNLFDPTIPSRYWYTPQLGYVSNYLVKNLPPGFVASNSIFYGWYVGVYSPDGGYGTSFYYRTVAFLPSGFAPSLLAPTKPRNVPEFPKGTRLPLPEPKR